MATINVKTGGFARSYAGTTANLYRLNPTRGIGIRGINIGGGLRESVLTAGAGRSDAEGSPAAPCMVLKFPGAFSFKWAVRAGIRTITVMVKQACNYTPRPTLTVKANPAIGVASDQTAAAPSGAGWVTIGPVAVTPTSNGAVLVELASNTRDTLKDGECYFDQIKTT